MARLLFSTTLALLSTILALPMLACGDDTTTESGESTDSGADADTDSDAESDTDADADTDADTDADADTEPPWDPSTRFAGGPLTWDIPDYGTTHQCFSPFSYSAVIDLDGDGRPDLVDGLDDDASEIHADASGPNWDLNDNDGDGFVKSPARWSVPSGVSSSLYQVYSPYSFHSLIDLDGDGLVDLVDGLDDDASDIHGGSGNPHWKLYRNEGEGFADRARSWSVPRGVSSSLYQISSPHSFYAVLDLDGDGLADLVDGLDDDTSEVHKAGGKPVWKLYKNEGDGFSISAVDWSVPAISNRLYQLYSPNSFHALIDLDGDGLLDLVDSDDDDGGGAFDDGGGGQAWHVYLNEGDGFAASPVVWSLPDGVSSDLYQVYSPLSFYTVLDIDGDGLPELIDAHDDDGGGTFGSAGSPAWRVYDNTGSGFSGTADSWPVPAARSSLYQFYSPHSYYTVMDLDGRSDLVDCQDDDGGSFGSGSSLSWRVYLGEP